MNLALLAAFWSVAIVLIVVPGPDWAFTIGAGLRDRNVVWAVGGIVLGYVALTLVVAAGVGVAVSRHPFVLTVITVAGAGFLGYLGVRLLARPGAIIPPEAGGRIDGTTRVAEGSSTEAETSSWVQLRRGAGVSCLNPKGLLIFIALLPQFTDPDASWPFFVQVIVLGLAFAATCAVFYTALGLSARAVLSIRTGLARLVARISGTAMILVAVGLLIEQIIHHAQHRPE